MRAYFTSTFVLLGLLLTEPALAAPHHIGSPHPVGGKAGSGLVYVPPQPVTPQFNNPGPQISVPQTGNAVEQLSPLFGAGEPDALGIK
jgi:hypothetical protein